MITALAIIVGGMVLTVIAGCLEKLLPDRVHNFLAKLVGMEDKED